MFRKILTSVVLMLLCAGNCPAQEEHELVWPPPPAPERIRYLSSLSSDGDIGVERSFFGKLWDAVVGREDVHFRMVQPLDIAVDAGGRIFVTDPGARCIHVFDTDEQEYDRITETENEQLISPVGIDIDAEGRIYVADADLKMVVIFDEDGDEEQRITGLFTRPTGVTILGDNLYVVDTGSNEVFEFTLSGEMLARFGNRGSGPGEFNFPVFVASADSLYLVDAMNFRVQVLSNTGKYLSGFGSQGTSIGHFAHPKGIALDSDRNIYVADALMDIVQIFDASGQLLLVVGGAGNLPGQFNNPSGVHVDRKDRVYVADALNGRVQIFQYLGHE